MLEAANLEVKAAQEKMKLQQEQAAKEKGMAAGPGGTSRQFEQARAGSASEVLNFAGGLGDRSISAMVQQERTKAAKEQQKVNRKEFDVKVMEQTSALTSGGTPRTLWRAGAVNSSKKRRKKNLKEPRPWLIFTKC